MQKNSFNHIFEVTIPNNTYIESSQALLLLLYNNEFLEYSNSNSIYGTLKKSIFNIPIGTPTKIQIISKNIVNIYYINNSIFYSIPIELCQEYTE